MADDGSGGGFISVLQNGVKALNKRHDCIGNGRKCDIAGEPCRFHSGDAP